METRHASLLCFPNGNNPRYESSTASIVLEVSIISLRYESIQSFQSTDKGNIGTKPGGKKAGCNVTSDTVHGIALIRKMVRGNDELDGARASARVLAQ